MNGVSGKAIVAIGVIAGLISALLPSVPTIYLLWNGHYPGMSETGKEGVKKVLLWSGAVALAAILLIVWTVNGKKR